MSKQHDAEDGSREFISSSEAFRNARERASVAATLEATTLHVAVFDAREAGLSVRETAAALNMPKRAVARHWREGHKCYRPIPAWGSASAWREAHAAIWAHNPSELADEWVPYTWRDDLDGRTVTHKYRGTATLAGRLDQSAE